MPRQVCDRARASAVFYNPWETFLQVLPASELRQMERSKPITYATPAVWGAHATGPNITVDFSTKCQDLPPSVDICTPRLVMRTRVESVGWTAYSMTMRPPCESVKGARCHALPLALT